MPSRARTAARSAGSGCSSGRRISVRRIIASPRRGRASGTRDALGAHQRLEQARQRPELRVARRHLVRIGEEARQVGAVGRLGIAMLEAREDAEHLEMALQPHPLERAPELAEVAVDRQPGLARHLPVAHRPVDLLLLVPGDEGVAQQRGDVVEIGPCTASWKSRMPGLGVATIRLRGIQSRCTATFGWARALATRRSQASAQVAASSRLQVTLHSRATHHSGKSASSRRSSASS